MPRRWCSFALCSSLALAQGAPTFVPKQPLMRLHAESVQALLAQLPRTRCGALLQQSEVAAAMTAALTRDRAGIARRRALTAAARERRVELDPWLSSSLHGW